MRRSFSLGLVLLAVLMLAGCGGRNSTQGSVAQPTAIEAWPDNEYTDGLPEPQGIPLYVIDDTSQGRFSVFYEQVDGAAWQNWLEQLEMAGFTCQAEASEEESENYLLTEQGRSLSASWSGDLLGISITLEEH